MVGRLGLMPAGPSGACVHLGEDNLCTIYETRPDICRVDRMHLYFLGMTKEEAYRLNAQACNKLQETFGADESYRVRIGE